MKIIHAVVSKDGVFGGGENIVELYSIHRSKQNDIFITNNKELYNRLESRKRKFIKLTQLNFLDFIRLIISLTKVIDFNEKYVVVSHHRFTTLSFSLMSLIYNIKIIHYIHYYSSNFRIINKLNINYIAVSNSLKKHWIEHYKIPPNKIAVIYNGSPTIVQHNQRIREFRNVFNIHDNIIRLGIIGRLTELKNHQLLIKSFHNILTKFDILKPQIKLFIIGDGELRVYLENLCKSLNLNDNIVFTGFWLRPYEISSVFNILIQPSISEGLPFTIIENLMAGPVFVASNIDPIKEVLGERYPYLFDSGSESHLTKVLLNVIKLFNNGDNTKVKEIQECLLNTYNSHFTVDKMFSSFDRFIYNLNRNNGFFNFSSNS